MVATVLVGAGNVTTAVKAETGNTLTAAIPANAVVGDVLIATYASDFASTAVTATPGWTKVTPLRTAASREVAVFHAFTKDGIPAPLVITQSGATVMRGSVAVFRVTGAHQTEMPVAGAWAESAETANTVGLLVPATGATAAGVTFSVAYNNATAAQGVPTGATVNGQVPTVQMTSYGAGTPGASSSTTQTTFVSTSSGPFTYAWGKTLANSQGLAVTVLAAGGAVTPDPEPEPEPEHADEPGVMIQYGPGNTSSGAVNDPSAAPSITVAMPSRARAGDVLIASVAHSGTTAVIRDAAWTLISKVRTGTNRWLSAYGYPVRETVPGPATFSTSAAGDRLNVLISRLTGVDSTAAPVPTLALTPAEDTPKIAFSPLDIWGGAPSIAGATGWYREKRLGAPESAPTLAQWENGGLDVNGSTYFRYPGLPGGIDNPSTPARIIASDMKPGGGAQYANWLFNIQFVTSAPVVELALLAGVTNGTFGMVMVDGKRVSENAIRHTGTAGSGFRATLTFPSAKPRTITIYGLNNARGLFGGVGVGPEIGRASCRERVF